MKFSTIFVSCAVLATGVVAQNATAATEGLQAVTDAFDTVRQTASTLSIANVLSVAPAIAQGISTIVQGITGITIDLHATDPTGVSFDDDDSAQIATVLNTSVQAQQSFYAVLIGQHGLIGLFGPAFTQPILLALQALEAAIDAYLAALTPLIPSNKADTSSAKGQLDTSIGQTIVAYQ